jgi:site-specific recombinase XerC
VALKVCIDPALRWVILAASEAGLRSGTAYRCTLGDCASGRIEARTKNARLTAVPLSPRLAALLATIDVQTPPGTKVVDALNGGPITQNALKRRWCLFRAKAGIRKELRLHDLRRGLARAVYQTTGDLRQAQAVLSHSNLTSTLWYLEGALPTLDRESIAAVLAAQEEKR